MCMLKDLFAFLISFELFKKLRMKMLNFFHFSLKLKIEIFEMSSQKLRNYSNWFFETTSQKHFIHFQ